MKWLWIVLAVLAGLVVIVAGIGALLPQAYLRALKEKFGETMQLEE